MVDLDWLTNFLEHFVYATDKTSYGWKRSEIPGHEIPGHEIPAQDKRTKLGSADINYPQSLTLYMVQAVLKALYHLKVSIFHPT